MKTKIIFDHLTSHQICTFNHLTKTSEQTAALNISLNKISDKKWQMS
jgi:uncharacterized membrane protein